MLTIEQTKKTLGDKYKNLSEEDIKVIRDAAHMFATMFVDSVIDDRDVVTSPHRQ